MLTSAERRWGSRPMASGPARRVAVAGAVVLAFALSACGARPSGTEGTSTTSSPAATTAMVSSLVLTGAKLPKGVFYVLAGPDAYSQNVWMITGHHQAQLTHNRRQYGISALSASRSGVVVADASSGYDEIGRLVDGKVRSIPGGHASVPMITSSGSVYFVVPGSMTFAIERDASFTSRPRVVYRQKESIGPVQIGPQGRVAFLSNPHPPGYGSGTRQVRWVVGTQQSRAVPSGVSDPSSLVWSHNAIGTAVDSYTVRGAVREGNGRKWSIPKGWKVLTWSPSGKTLLLHNATELGQWAPGKAQWVKVIAIIRRGMGVSEAAWLPSAAKGT